MSNELTGREIARARQNLYTLLSRLYTDGLRPEYRPYLAGVPVFNPYLHQLWDPDEASAYHTHLFELNIFPFESIFLDSSGLVGGSVVDHLLKIYAEIGYRPDAKTSPDHLGQELAALAFLCQREADGGEQPGAAGQKEQVDFLAAHLLRWLIPCLVEIQEETTGSGASWASFYHMLAGVTLELVADHVAAGTPSPDRPDKGPVGPLPGGQPPVPAGGKGWAQALTIPVYAGCFLSREAIGRLARSVDLPRGFGSRKQMLENLFAAALHYEMLPALAEGFDRQIGQRINAYRQIMSRYPVLAPYTAGWLARLEETRHDFMEWATTIRNG